ncbi:SDR family oxidoreductase [Nocardia macrotermitis]|uniref:Quinone oxidoreductase 2 n=1 Tax=Nocardia macrotermitis TaxID=2585198 RepID=A0A7K0CZN4_9NOCA|nr:SDR family oxidoreductase [Nocardia macrotermitis]MQY18134.1 Quinone oxidoreductase 2 [Nocardia macrotermitis]
MTETVAVTGASGQLGRLVVEALLRRNAGPIVAIVRNPAKVADLAERGVDVREASYGDDEAFDRALAGVDRLLLISGTDFGDRVAQHTAVIRAAERAGVKLVAYTSIPRADVNPMALAQEHRGTEAVLAESPVPHVFLRNGWYWENYADRVAAAAEYGALAGAAGGGRVSAAARADYAEAAAAVLTTDGHAGRSYELGGDAITYPALAQVISELSGKPVAYSDVPEADYAAVLEQNGLPAPVAQILANADTGVRDGWLEVATTDLTDLIGRPAASPTEVFRSALAK